MADHLALEGQALYEHMLEQHGDVELPEFQIIDLWHVLKAAHLRDHAEQN